MLYKYRIEVNNSNNLKDNDMLNCSMELSLLNNLFKENLITEAKYQEIKRKILNMNFINFVEENVNLWYSVGRKLEV